MTITSYDEIPVSASKELPKWSLRSRIEHFLIFTSVLLLVATGFPLKFHDAPWAMAMADFFGGPAFSTWIHRIAGLVMAATCAVHFAFIVYNLAITRGFRAKFEYLNMLPDLKDLDDLIDDFKYYLFLSDRRPHKRSHDYAGKLEYLSLYWGCPLVAVTGLIMWFKEWFYNIDVFGLTIPAWLINICRIAHGMEAVLAFSVVAVVHWYMVHWNPDVFPARWTWVTGTMPDELMKEEHRLEYEKLTRRDDLDKAEDHDSI
jgi:cytochrome b subunit of formate dehydrogenase